MGSDEDGPQQKRLLHELRQVREMAVLVTAVLMSGSIKKWERRRRPNRCDFGELLVPLP